MTLPFNVPSEQQHDHTVPMAPGWRPALTILGLLLLLAVTLYYPTYSDMVGIWWRSGTFNHCFLILPISLYLIQGRRAELIPIPPTPSAPALFVLFGTALVWGLAHAADIMVLQHLAAVMFWPLLAWSILGDRIAWQLLFPLCYLLFAVPTGEALVPTLQDVTAHFAVKLLQWTGMPVLLEGRHISIPSGNFVVAEACSGINYLIASLALGTLYAYLQYRSWTRRLAFAVVSLVVPIIANGLRAYGIIMIAHASDMTLAVGIDHIIYGWLFFGIVILLMFWVGNFFREDGLPASTTQGAADTATSGVSARRLMLTVPVAALCLCSGWGLAGWINAASNLAPASASLPVVEGQWRGPALSDDPLLGTYPGAQRLVGVYDSPDGSLFLSLAYYASERQGEELVGTLNHVFDEKRWQRLEETRRTIPGLDRDVQVLHLSAGAQEYLVYTWFDVAGRTTASEVRAKLLGVYSRLTRQRGGQAAISLIAPLNGDRAASERLLDAYLLSLREPLAHLTVSASP